MTRRQFVAASAATAAVGAAGVTALEAHPLSRWLSGEGGNLRVGAGVLVLITLYGGNDGLNTVIPLDDPRYLKARGSLAYQPNLALALDRHLGLNPRLTGLHDLWKQGRLAIVRGAGYPQPNRSHFVSMDIWQSAVPDRPSDTGWLGRWLDKATSDPLRALSIGPTVPRALTGAVTMATAVPTGSLALPGGDRTARLLSAMATPSPNLPPLAADAIESQANFLAAQGAIVRALGPQPPQKQSNPIAAQLDIVRALITSGVPAQVYSVTATGFDTHAAEKQQHADLLAQLDAGITGFLSALLGKPHGDGVTVVAYSEFGRRVAANASGGTDHGTAGPVFIAGPAVKGGFYGEEPPLDGLDANGDLKFTVDFRSIYTTVLSKVLASDPDVAIDGKFPALHFV